MLIVGAGLAGLMAARHAQAAGLSVTVLDKGRSAGGRLATRRIGDGKADHGAQFFTVRDGAFARFVADWQARGLVDVWSRGWSDGSLFATRDDGFPRYSFRGGMNAMAADLAARLKDIRLNVTLQQISPIEGGWQLTDSTGAVFTARALVMTPPVPQSLTLLKAGQTALDPLDQAALDRIVYAPCLAGLILLDRPAGLPEPGAVQRTDHWVPWIADNQAKGISDAPVLTLHMDETYSRANYDAPEEKILADLEPEWRAFTGDAQVIEAQVKRWRYSRPLAMHPQPTLLARSLPPLAFAGDAFSSPRVEGAALSGIAAAEVLIPLL
jgi:predicted NAD/FAD-dependent oxidoreductase